MHASSLLPCCPAQHPISVGLREISCTRLVHSEGTSYQAYRGHCSRVSRSLGCWLPQAFDGAYLMIFADAPKFTSPAAQRSMLTTELGLKVLTDRLEFAARQGGVVGVSQWINRSMHLERHARRKRYRGSHKPRLYEKIGKIFLGPTDSVVTKVWRLQTTAESLKVFLHLRSPIASCSISHEATSSFGRMAVWCKWSVAAMGRRPWSRAAKHAGNRATNHSIPCRRSKGSQGD